jgi:hypothetical protein
MNPTTRSVADGVLRRLLIDDQLGLVWRSMEFPRDARPTIEAVDIDGPAS